jgi:branched-chain amino acid transport system permease protein
MQDLMQVIVTTVTSGVIVALIALGINVVFATTRIVNFAQAGIVVAAGYIAYLLTDSGRFGLNVWIALFITVAIGIIMGVLLELVGIAPLGQFDPSTNIGWIITTFAIGTLFIPSAISKWISQDTQTVPPLKSGVAFSAFDVAVTWSDIILVVVSVGLVIGLEILLSRTMLGKAFNAVAQDRTTATLMGINTGRIVLLSFGIAGGLGAIAAVLIAPKLLVQLQNSVILSVQALVAAVFGGLGSTRGAVVGGFTVAFVRAVCVVYGSKVVADGGNLSNLIIFGGLLLVLAIRPRGLFGKPVVEKV